MNISIFGLGYVGCVSLGCLASFGHHIIGVDVNNIKVQQIKAGKPTIIEKDIESIISQQFELGRIDATNDYKKAILETDISIICVGTPSSVKGHLNLDYIYKVAEEIGSALKGKKSFHTVVVRSTVLPGTNARITEIIEQISGKKSNTHFGVVSNPEFLREGSAVQDFKNPPVTVIGSSCKKSTDLLIQLYKDIGAPIRVVDIKIAEFIKYVNNSFHALKISFANEVGNISKQLGIDGREVMQLFCEDNHLNISPYYFKPGFAYGGSCLPKDLKGLKMLAHDYYLDSPIIENIEDSNNNQKQRAIDIIKSKNIKNIDIVGLSFKSGTDDLRYSPAVEVAEFFLGKGYALRIYDKNVRLSRITGTNKDYIEDRIPHLSDLLVENINQLLKNSQLIVITHQSEISEEIIKNNPQIQFIDLVGITKNKYENYEGICW